MNLLTVCLSNSHVFQRGTGDRRKRHFQYGGGDTYISDVGTSRRSG